MSKEKTNIKENIGFILECPFCDSTNIVKAGKTQAGFKKIQVYGCVNCNKTLLDGDRNFALVKVSFVASIEHESQHEQKNVIR